MGCGLERADFYVATEIACPLAANGEGTFTLPGRWLSTVSVTLKAGIRKPAMVSFAAKRISLFLQRV